MGAGLVPIDPMAGSVSLEEGESYSPAEARALAAQRLPTCDDRAVPALLAMHGIADRVPQSVLAQLYAYLDFVAYGYDLAIDFNEEMAAEGTPESRQAARNSRSDTRRIAADGLRAKTSAAAVLRPGH